MTELEQLKATRALITDKAYFTTGARARNKDHIVCEADSPEARYWCVIGAWERETGYDDDGVLDVLCNCNPVIVNDEKGHKAVLKMLDHAIKRLTP